MADVCAGIGSLSLAGSRAGMDVRGHIEINPYKQRVLRKNFTGQVLGDLYEIKEFETVDLVAGGTPCQDISLSGSRRGLDGEQSKLFWEFLRFIDIVNPRWVVWENVPGILSVNDGRDFATVLLQLAKRGFSCTWRVLDAQYFGVPQRRRRIFVVGSFGNGRSSKVLLEPESVPGNLNTSPAAWNEDSRVVGTLTASAGRNRGLGQQNELDLLVYNEVEFGLYSPDTKTSTLVKTVQKRATHITIQDNRVRRLTPLECLRLQGFPDNWCDGLNLSDLQKFAMAGDSIAVPVAEWIMKRIMLYA